MAQDSPIEWTEATWNPVTGCTKISPGCKHCYAERMAHRLQAMGQQRYRNGFRLTLQPDVVDAPLHWKRGRLIFVNSMSDLFQKDIPLAFIQQVFSVMAAPPYAVTLVNSVFSPEPDPDCRRCSFLPPIIGSYSGPEVGLSEMSGLAPARGVAIISWYPMRNAA